MPVKLNGCVTAYMKAVRRLLQAWWIQVYRRQDRKNERIKERKIRKKGKKEKRKKNRRKKRKKRKEKTIFCFWNHLQRDFRCVCLHVSNGGKAEIK